MVTAALWGTGQLVSTITYNGVSLSQLMSPAVANNGDVTCEAWGLSSPATGSHNIVVTLNGSNDFLALAWSFTGHAVTPYDTCVGDGYASSGGSHAHDTSCATDGFVVDLFAANSAIGTLTANAGQTSRLASTDQNTLRVIATSKAGASTVNTGYDWGSVNFARWAHVTVPIMPAAVGGGLFRTPSMSGIGAGGSFFRDPLEGV